MIPDSTLLEQTSVRFNYQLNVYGNPELISDYVVVADELYYANKEIDYALIEVANNPGEKWGHLGMGIK